jgi:ribosomal protein S12 methylthiotransferase
MSALNVQNRKTYNIYGRIFESANHYSYLKIAEGCNRNCSFCAIPLFKGKYVSRETDEILQEAKVLSDNGVKELLLIAQDLSFYGYDLKKKFLLSELIEKLSVIDGIEWIRMHYLYPFLFPEKVIDIAAENPKICKYFDIPVQHISDKILQMMNRGGTKAETYKLIEKIRKKIPDAAIRTSLLVGHPGEGKREFEELLEFVKIIKFDRLGVFEYSEEEGTKSAKNYKDTIKTSVKKQRSKMIMDIQAEISLELNLKKVGRSFKTIVDEFDGKFYYGRTEFDSPEVDNEVIFTSLEKIETGQFVQVNIESADEYSLRGKKI